MIKTIIIGAGGRMGCQLISEVLNDSELTLAGAVEMTGSPAVGRDAGALAGAGETGIKVVDDFAAIAAAADAVIDFSHHTAAPANAAVAARAGLLTVIGTTGLTAAEKSELLALADDGARIVFAPNMSVGVNLLFHLCGQVARILGDDYDIEVVEMHHNQKKDAPSGTAVRLAEVLAEATGVSYADDVVHGRAGMVGARTKREIGMHALRGGDVVGDHTVIFATEGERVELTHKASSRATFAKGAVRAVKFLNQAAPGLYDMQDVLGLI
ncbi:MAG: 4-hydroxy-tetrahydrodipicolinate reductase [Lentisphaeria bacterium]|nr:4-hydroxy-tetrahydrodipicolinate reductase [Lentisphaeria bacterium]